MFFDLLCDAWVMVFEEGETAFSTALSTSISPTIQLDMSGRHKATSNNLTGFIIIRLRINNKTRHIHS